MKLAFILCLYIVAICASIFASRTRKKLVAAKQDNAVDAIEFYTMANGLSTGASHVFWVGAVILTWFNWELFK